MKNKTRYSAMLLGLLVGVGSTVSADVMTLSPSDDSWVNGAAPTGNYGTLSDMRQRYQNATWGLNYGMTTFDLSALPANIVVNSARMRFYTGLNSWPGATNFAPIAIFNNTQDWVESTVTFGTAPSYDATATETLDHFGLIGVDEVYFTGANTITGGGWLEYTSAETATLVEGWATGTIPNYGVSIMATGDYVDSAREFRLQTSDHPTAAVHPSLIVNYTIIPEPATFGLFGIVGAAMLFVRRRFKR